MGSILQIGVFKGRKGRYNQLILKTLYEKGHSSAWKIAKNIVNIDPKRAKANWYHETQKVNSVLARKGGRLEELVAKEFIESAEQGYQLTVPKGLCAALILYEEVIEPKTDEFSRAYEILPELQELMEIVSRLYPETKVERYRVTRKATMELLDKGLNLDVVSNRQFNVFLNDQYNRTMLDKMKEEREKSEKWEQHPELQECVLKLVDRMKKICLNQLEELDKELESFKESIPKAPTRETGE